jgi:hypothetical protein
MLTIGKGVGVSSSQENINREAIINNPRYFINTKIFIVFNFPIKNRYLLNEI